MIKILQEWLNLNLTKDLTVVEDETFYYNIILDEVSFAKNIPLSHDKEFVDFYNSLGLIYDCGPFLMSFLHEVGHYFTLEDEELDEYWEDYLNNANTLQLTAYYNHPIEKAATIWAVEYINKNIDKIKSLENKLNERIDK